MEGAVSLILGPFVAIMVHAFSPEAEPAKPPPPSRAVNICYGTKMVDGLPEVDYSIDKCARARSARTERHP